MFKIRLADGVSGFIRNQLLLLCFIGCGPLVVYCSIGRSPLLQPVTRAWNLASLLTFVPDLQRLRAFQEYQDIYRSISESAKNGRMDGVNLFLHKVESNVFFGLRAWEFFRLLHSDMNPIFESGEFKNMSRPKRKRQRDPGELWDEFDDSLVQLLQQLFFSGVKILEMQAVYRFRPADVRKGRIFGHSLDCPSWHPREFSQVALIATSAAADEYKGWMQDVMNSTTFRMRLSNHHHASAVGWAFHAVQLAQEMGLDAHEYEKTLEFTIHNHDNAWKDEPMSTKKTEMNRVPKKHFLFSEKIGNKSLEELQNFLNTQQSIYSNQANDEGAELFSEACITSLDAAEIPTVRPLARRPAVLIPKRLLHCTLEFKKPLFLLAPLKKEILHDEPELTVYHGAFPASRCKKVLKLLGTSKKSMRSTLVGGAVHASRRISTTALQFEFTFNRTNLMTKELDGFMSALANLDFTDSEGWQFQNYESGEFYGQHIDPGTAAGDVNSWRRFGGSSRIATLLLYLNDEDQGGATAYPKLGVHSSAQQGNVLVMYNHGPDGLASPLMAHGGCPVIFGTKTIAVKWIHGPSQFLTRPCPAGAELKSKLQALERK